MERILTEEQLREISKYWIAVLGLGEWEIVVFVYHKGDLNLECVSGEVEYTFVNRCAVIRILHPKDYKVESFKYDMEETLVHELLHLKFDHVCHPKGDLNKHHHQLLNDMAVALLKVRDDNEASKKIAAKEEGSDR